MLQELGTLPITLFGSDELQGSACCRAAPRGEWLAAFALSEAEAGSDPARDAHARAVRDGDDWVINGTKTWISNAGVADVYIVFAVTDRDARRASRRSSSRPTGPGFSIGGLEHKLGHPRLADRLAGASTTCACPPQNVIGEVGRGHARRARARSSARGSAPPRRRSGIAQGATDYAVAYASERIAFGKPIIELQGIQFKLADMADRHGRRARAALPRVRAGRRAAAAADLGMWTSMAKLFASDNAMKVTIEAVQVLGGYGYVTDYPVERMMRDAKITQIYEGTNEIQRVVIARHLAG